MEQGQQQRSGQAAEEDLAYEQARDELIEVVRRLETGGLSLDESLDLWERGESLARHCQAKLDGARARLDAALAAADAANGQAARPVGTPED